MRCKEISETQVKNVKKEGGIFIINVVKTKTKIRRSFVIDKKEYVGLVAIYCKERPKNLKIEDFFFNYRNGKAIAQVIGVNQFYKFPEKIANFLELPDAEKYTGHSFRVTSTTLLGNEGACIRTIQKHGGWRSAKIAEHYVQESIYFKKVTSNLINRAIDSARDESAVQNVEAIDLARDESEAQNVEVNFTDNNATSTLNVHSIAENDNRTDLVGENVTQNSITISKDVYNEDSCCTNTGDRIQGSQVVSQKK